MPYCTNCGEEVTDEQRYCSYCGEPVGDVSRREQGGRPANSHSHAQEPVETHQSGFEGDPPPEGYEDPPGVGATDSRTAMATPDTLELFGASLRQSLGLPLAFGGLLVAWLIFFLFDLFGTGGQLLGFALSGLVGLFVAGLIYVAVEANREGRSSTTGDQASRVSGQLLSMIAVWVLFIPAFLLGLLLLLLPGLYIAGRLFLAFPAVVLGEESPLQSLSTSWELTSGISLKPFGLLVLAFLAAVILSIILSIISVTVLVAAGADLPADAGESPNEAADQLADQPRFLVAAAVSQSIALALVVGAVQVAAARLYLDRRRASTEPTPR